MKVLFSLLAYKLSKSSITTVSYLNIWEENTSEDFDPVRIDMLWRGEQTLICLKIFKRLMSYGPAFAAAVGLTSEQIEWRGRTKKSSGGNVHRAKSRGQPWLRWKGYRDHARCKELKGSKQHETWRTPGWFSHKWWWFCIYRKSSLIYFTTLNSMEFYLFLYTFPFFVERIFNFQVQIFTYCSDYLH